MNRALLVFVANLALMSSAAAHQGHDDPARWQVCEGSETGSPCAFRPASGDLHRGTCQAMSGHAVCVRNQPIVPAGRPSPRMWLLAPAIAIGAALLAWIARAWGRAR